MRTPSIAIDFDQDGLINNNKKYWGRCPRMIHSIPESNIWECNPEYIYLLEQKMLGTLNNEIVSVELWRELEEMIDKMGGSGQMTEEESQLVACFGVEHAPSPITTLSATDTLHGEIIVTWDADATAMPYPIYYLYEDGVIVGHNISSPYTINRDDVTHDYYIIATNKYGTETSNIDSGTALSTNYVPGPIVNFSASDNAQGLVVVSWTHSIPGNPQSTYDLYADNILVATGISSGYMYPANPGTAIYHVMATNSEGSILSNNDSGTSIGAEAAPGIMNNFIASDNQYDQVTVSWMNDIVGNPTPTYNLYEDNLLVATNITSPYVHAVVAGRRNYFLMISNPSGSLQSNTDFGTSLEVSVAPGPVLNVDATDTELGSVLITWDAVASPSPVSYSIYEDGVLLTENADQLLGYNRSVAPGTRVYVVEADNGVLPTSSGSDMGTSIGLVYGPPQPILNMNATDTEDYQVTITWDPVASIPSCSYNIYQEDTLIATNIDALIGYIHKADPGTYVYKVVAHNGLDPSSIATDNGTAMGVPVGPPGQVLNMSATDNLDGMVKVTWDAVAANPQVRYEIYNNGTLLSRDASQIQGFTHHRQPGTGTYRVVATNDIAPESFAEDPGTALGVVVGAPGPVLNMSATDTLIGEVVITWDLVPSLPISTYSIYRDGILINDNGNAALGYTDHVGDGTYTYRVAASNGIAPDTFADDDGTSMPLPITSPGPVLNMDATDNLVNEVVVSWDHVIANPPVKHAIYLDNVLVIEDAVSPYSHIRFEGTGMYKVVASNGMNPATEASDSGTSIAPAFVALTLPQFTDTTSVTAWAKIQPGVTLSSNLEITNTFAQPTLMFETSSFTSGTTTFINNGTISGTNPEDDALIVTYEVLVLNNGTIRGAGGNGGLGGKGGNGGDGGVGASVAGEETVTATELPHSATTQWTTITAPCGTTEPADPYPHAMINNVRWNMMPTYPPVGTRCIYTGPFYLTYGQYTGDFVSKGSFVSTTGTTDDHQVIMNSITTTPAVAGGSGGNGGNGGSGGTGGEGQCYLVPIVLTGTTGAAGTAGSTGKPSNPAGGNSGGDGGDGGTGGMGGVGGTWGKAGFTGSTGSKGVAGDAGAGGGTPGVSGSDGTNGTAGTPGGKSIVGMSNLSTGSTAGNTIGATS